jgi:EmrB/QacA subfamily drug resistance transporter
MSPPPAPPPASRIPLDPLVWKVGAVAALGPFLSNLDSTVVNVSLSTLSRELHAPLNTIQWVTSAYLLALALMLPLTGWLVERVGARRVYLGCFTVFTLASVLCGLAASAGALIAARVFQGMAGGLLAPMAQLMIARHAGPQLPRVMGVIVLPVLLGPILGPVLAGFILQHASWRWLFFINLPVGVLALVLAWRLLPREEPLRARPLDAVGFLLVSPALVFLLDGSEGLVSSRGARELRGVELLASAGLFLAFVLHSRRLGARGLVDFRLFTRRLFRTAATTQFSSNAMLMGGQFLVPLYLVTARGLSPLAAGVLLAPMGVGIGVASALMGRLLEHFGPRALSSAGALLTLVATLPFCFPALPLSHALLGGVLFLRGLGMGCVNIPSITSAYNSVRREDLPSATTAVNIVQRLGGPIGTTGLAMLLAHSGAAPGLPTAFTPSFWLLCGFSAACLVAAWRLPVRLADVSVAGLQELGD